MGSLKVHVWTANNTDEKWSDKAISAVGDLDNQVDFDMPSYDRPSASVKLGSDYSSMLDNWESWLENNANVDDEDVHLLIIDEADSDLGAGALRGEAIGKKPKVDGSYGCAAYANAAVRWNSDCHGNEDVYSPTVMHEVCHGGLHDEMDLPENGNEHSAGANYYNGDYYSPSPLQLWYTADGCGANSPPADNCTGNPDVYAGGASQTISSCTENNMEEYVIYL